MLYNVSVSTFSKVKNAEHSRSYQLNCRTYLYARKDVAERAYIRHGIDIAERMHGNIGQEYGCSFGHNWYFENDEYRVHVELKEFTGYKREH